MQKGWPSEPRFSAMGIVLLSLMLGSVVESRVQAETTSERVVLNTAAIVCDPGEPSFVQFAVEELVGYLQEVTGQDVVSTPTPTKSQGVQIVVGNTRVQQLLPGTLPGEKLGEEEYILKCITRDGLRYVVAAGTSPQGTKAALAALLKRIEVEGKQAFVASSLDVRNKPASAKRGMHLNGWALRYPYSFRNWREVDWQRYLDFLSCQGVNLFYLWPFLEIMPVPFSAEDQAYLEECRRVIDYAQKKHGMEVWIMQCTNRVAKDRCGVDDPRERPYWRPSQEDLHPGKPEDLKRILASREAMYRILDNADGVCNIDSDPGFCPDSCLSDYVQVLQGCRTLLDRYNQHGREAKLINWMLWGWGCDSKLQLSDLIGRERQTVQMLKQSLPEPLWLISGQQPEYVPICREAGLASRTILLRYSVIEGEPAYPQTQLNLPAIREMFEGADAQAGDLAGVMGNVQTPLLQFPNLYYFTSIMADFGYRTRSEREVLLDLAGYLYPEHRELVADSYLALRQSDPAMLEELANRLQELLDENRLGRPGLFGRKLFPDHRIVASSLALQLRLRATRQRLLEIEPATPRQACVERLGDYFEAYIAWDGAHGWHQLWGWQAWPLPDLPVAELAKKIRATLGSDAEVESCFVDVAQRLSASHEAAVVESGCIAPLKQAVLACTAPAGK